MVRKLGHAEHFIVHMYHVAPAILNFHSKGHHQELLNVTPIFYQFLTGLLEVDSITRHFGLSAR